MYYYFDLVLYSLDSFNFTVVTLESVFNNCHFLKVNLFENEKEREREKFLLSADSSCKRLQ